jgi:phospholipid transport system substrate-binding protein
MIRLSRPVSARTVNSVARHPWVGPRHAVAGVCLFISLICAAAWGVAADVPDQGPVQVIQRFQDTLLSVMKQAQSLGYDGRYKQLAPVVSATHDLAAIARVSVGRYWEALSAAQRDKLVDTFSRLSIATYAARFDGYSGETFSTPVLERHNTDRALVRTDLNQSDGEKVSFNYQLHNADGQWRIVNIITNGVSDLAMKRAEYTSVIKKDGFDALIGKLEEKITQYQKGSSA